MKEILITNDDGYEAKGLLKLAKRLKKLPDTKVTIVAPSTEKSACAHSLTLTKPLKFIKIRKNFYKLDDATPSDCIYLALHALYDKKPDLIISGINHGANLGEDISYSGTCGACMEGALQGIASIAFSQFYQKDSLEKFGFKLAVDIAEDIVKKVLWGDFPLPQRQFLNVNIPAVKKQDFKGYVVVPAGKRCYDTDASRHHNPRNIEYYWLGRANLDYFKQKTPSDIGMIYQAYATLTPIKLDFTAHESLEKLKFWLDLK
ncbi:MAG: 5'/3'-nucleotidase SurE [Campylobacter sp.]|nr:5'/3'-nucleotidase SurE [Campylobacter sp.]